MVPPVKQKKNESIEYPDIPLAIHPVTRGDGLSVFDAPTLVFYELDEVSGGEEAEKDYCPRLQILMDLFSHKTRGAP